MATQKLRLKLVFDKFFLPVLPNNEICYSFIVSFNSQTVKYVLYLHLFVYVYIIYNENTFYSDVCHDIMRKFDLNSFVSNGIVLKIDGKYLCNPYDNVNTFQNNDIVKLR